ncbi:MAG: ATP-dependent helicase [Candidatus Marinimicrobia bacterium]|nr:ATP-dependent helicase [Candidatus Neomarinimicrobiota bacterium]
MTLTEPTTFSPTDDQRRAITHPLAPLMILAGPGTGKTFTLIHRIGHLISHRGVAPQSILALTFTERGAGELQTRIREQTGVQEKIAAMTFHAFCYQVVQEFLPEFRSRRLMTTGDILFLLREHFSELTGLQSATFRGYPMRAIQAFHSFFDRVRDELIPPSRFPELLRKTRAGMEQEIMVLEESKGPGWQKKVRELDERYRQLQDHCQVYPRYQQWKGQEGFMDYGDMITECWHLLSEQPGVLAALQERYQTIIVDEFQDNNHALNLIVEQLVLRHLSITVVGDEDQCIYSFRGASAHNFVDFQHRYGHHPAFGLIVLKDNFRSTQPILNLAEAAIRSNPDRTPKQLAAHHPGRELPRLLISRLGDHVPLLVTELTRHAERGRPLEELAVLVDSNVQAHKVVDGLAQGGIPTGYVHVEFFRLPAIRTALAWCDLAAGTHSAGMALHRVFSTQLGRPPDGETFAWLIGRLTTLDQNHREIAPPPSSVSPALERLAQHVERLQQQAQTVPADELLWNIYTVSGLYRRHYRSGAYYDRLTLLNLNHLLKIAQSFVRQRKERSLRRFMRYMGVMRQAGSVEGIVPPHGLPSGAVQVMTVHQAKGLEFSQVYIPFLASGSFPKNYTPPREVREPPPDWHPWQSGRHSDPKEAYYQEKRRVFYVALTRAKDGVTFLAPEKRRSQLVKNLPSKWYVEESPMAATDTPPVSTHQELQTRLGQRLSQELADHRYPQAHELVQALELVDQHERGLTPDWSVSPLGSELRGKLEGPAATPPTGEAFTLSSSKIVTYENCPLQYRFQHIDHVPTKDESSPALIFGRVVHQVLEAYHHIDNHQAQRSILEILEDKWTPGEFAFPQESDQHYQDAVEILTRYASGHPPDEPQIAAVEHPFEFEQSGIVIRGKIDRIDVDPAGRITLIDYKTSRSPRNRPRPKRKCNWASMPSTWPRPGMLRSMAEPWATFPTP